MRPIKKGSPFGQMCQFQTPLPISYLIAGNAQVLESITAAAAFYVTIKSD